VSIYGATDDIRFINEQMNEGGIIMTLTRWNPVRDMMTLQRELNRVFNESITKRNEEGYDSAVWSPRVDISENEEQFELALDLPGIDKKDVKISYNEDTLSISGERFVENYDKVLNQYMERSYGKFYRSFSLPGKVNADAIAASYDNGVLTIKVPKAEEVKPKAIEIQ
jgi:HSP20 family protein